MSALSFTAGAALPPKGGQIAMTGRLALAVMVPVWIFSGGFVWIEPSPYEVMFAIVMGLVAIAGIPIDPKTRNLIAVIVVFLPAAMIAAARVRFTPVTDAVIYSSVTVFLLLTAFVAANYIAEAPFARMRVINSAYVAIAVVVALIGILAYIGMLPGEDVFLKFGRAKATFKDPNVYGPFLLYPAAVVLQRILLGNARQIAINAAILLVLFVGIFVSFSRGAWGHFAATSAIVFLGVYFLAANPRQRTRMVLIGAIGAVALALVLAGLLTLEPVRHLFAVRAELVQDYDTGAFGRFGRQAYAVVVALNDPLGMGPMQFGRLRVGEEPHNTYLKVLIAYGWAGGFAIIWLTAMTIWRAVKSLAIPSPNRLLLIPAVATFVPLMTEAAIIDIDHWRHFFLLIGLIWGVTAGYGRLGETQRAGALP